MKEPLRCRAPAVATIQLDDANVRVTRWDFEPGAETGWHRHGMAYVVVPVTDGTLFVELPGGETLTADLKAVSLTGAPQALSIMSSMAAPPRSPSWKPNSSI